MLFKNGSHRCERSGRVRESADKDENGGVVKSEERGGYETGKVIISVDGDSKMDFLRRFQKVWCQT